MVAIITNKEYIKFFSYKNGCALNSVCQRSTNAKNIIANANTIQFEFLSYLQVQIA